VNIRSLLTVAALSKALEQSPTRLSRDAPVPIRLNEVTISFAADVGDFPAMGAKHHDGWEVRLL
jgi:hypothetical protein